MTRNDPTPERDDAAAELLHSIERSAAEATPAELSEALAHLLTLGGEAADRLANTALPPSRRRPRRPDVVTYRVRVDLVGTRPPLWRRLELASDLNLDAVHDALQAAFGWTDSHLHRFASGPSRDSHDLEYYLCPFDVEEDDVGVPEHSVRLDEVLVDPGDRLFYDYDYGDNWQHTITLEAVESRDADAPLAVCTTGRRPGPAEDCGGVYGYELIVAASDPTHADHAEAVIEYADMYGHERRPRARWHHPVRPRRDQCRARRARTSVLPGHPRICPSLSPTSSPPFVRPAARGGCSECSARRGSTHRSTSIPTPPPGWCVRTPGCWTASAATASS